MREYWEFMIDGEKQDIRFSNKFFLHNRNNSGNDDVIDRTNNKSSITESDNRVLLTKLVKHLHNMKYRVFFVDITPADIRKIGLIVVKVLISQTGVLSYVSEFLREVY